MNRLNFLKSATTITVAATLVASCASSSNDKGLRQVDDLLDMVERVHVESELSVERVHDALDSLHVIVSPDFNGDAVVAYADFVAAVDASEEQADVLRDTVEDMEDSAQDVFDRWTDNLDVFTNAKMRRRSRARLQDNRERYEAILDATLPAQSGYDLFNESLRDHALFLGTDLNAGAVAEIEMETRLLSDIAQELEGAFDECLSVTADYVASAALPGQGLEGEEEAPRDKVSRSSDKESGSGAKPRTGKKPSRKSSGANKPPQPTDESSGAGSRERTPDHVQDEG